MGGSGESLRERTELTPQSINSAKPFRSKAFAYVELGWVNPMPLPAKSKEPPPTGFTGKVGKTVTKDDLDQWFSESQTERSNVAIHLGFDVGSLDGMCVIGIDVDENDDNPKKPKRGGAQLKRLEELYGELPPTWTSSARDNGIAGIRFFLAPSELEWRGNCSAGGGPHIDLVTLGHKYAIVYPSIHPKGGQYIWFPPGVKPSGPSALDGFDWSSIGYDDPALTGDTCVIPNVADLAVLPDDWVDFLTRGRTEMVISPMEMDLDTKEIQRWAIKNFVPGTGSDGGMCKMMREAVAKHIANVEDNDDHHYPLQEAHWHLFKLGSEGHHGWIDGVKLVENAWRERVIGEGQNVSKRSAEKAERELKRSREGALRKIKGEIDFAVKEQKLNLINTIELCYDSMSSGNGMNSSGSSGNGSGSKSVGNAKDSGRDSGRDSGSGSDGGSGSGGGNWLDNVPMDDQPDPKGYDCNDIDQARFFLDVFESSVRYIPEIKAWVIYDGMTWHKDEFGSVSYLYNRGCLQPTKKRMLKALSDSQQVLRNNGNNNQDPAYTQLANIHKNCKKTYEKYGNTNGIRGMLEAAHQKPGVAIEYNQLNHDDTVLAMPNGKVIKLERRGRDESKNKGSQGYSIVPNRKSFYTTMKTANNFRSYSELEATEDGKEQLRLWKETLGLLLPDKELRLFVQRVFGHMILGGNDEKKMVFLAGRPHTGKSTLLKSFDVLGDYSGTFNPAAIMEDDGSKPNPELMTQWHRRVIHNSESGLTNLSTAMIKKLTGRDPVKARLLYSNKMTEGVPKFTTITATNIAPTIKSADKALRNRMLALPIETVVTRDVDDKSMTTSISERCGDAILLWLLDGYRQYVQIGLDENTWPAVVSYRTEEFNDEISDVASFLRECFDFAPEEILNVVKREGDWDAGMDSFTAKKYLRYRSHTVGDITKLYLRWSGISWDVFSDAKALRAETRKMGKELRGMDFVTVQGKVNGVNGKRIAGLKMKRGIWAEFFGTSAGSTIKMTDD